jgi:hypothetical protein
VRREFHFQLPARILLASESRGEAKIFLVISSKTASIDARQSSGVRGSSFTAMNAGVSSEAVLLRSAANFSEPAHGFLV